MVASVCDGAFHHLPLPYGHLLKVSRRTTGIQMDRAAKRQVGFECIDHGAEVYG
jgi:hypothetical protein